MANQESSGQAEAPATVVQTTSLLDQIVQDGRMGKDESTKERGKDLVKEFVAQVLDGSMTVTRDAETMINARIAQIDHLLSIQLNEILHHPTFQKLEGSWRGLKYLLDQSETNDQLKIKVLNVSKRDLLRDLQRARSSTRAPCSRRSTKRNSASSVERPSPPSSATTSSVRGLRISSCWNASR